MTDDEDRLDFTEFLANHDRGTTALLAGARLQRVVAACLAHKGGGKSKGKVTLTLDIEANDGRAAVAVSIKSTEPQPGSLTASYFTTEDGRLHDENPRQTQMPARILAPTPIRGGQS